MLLADLVRRSGCPASTIHYYRRLGLLPAPTPGPGRASTYALTHLQRLARIAELRASRGLSLRQIARELPPAPPALQVPVTTTASRLAANAAEVLISRGLEGLSMDDLAEAIGVGKPTLYRHFAGRAALLGACFAGGHIAVAGCAEIDPQDIAPGEWLADRLRCAVSHRQRARGVERLCLALWEDDDGDLRAAARRAHGQIAQGFAAAGLTRFARRGVLPQRDPHQAARALWGAVAGLCDGLDDNADGEDGMLDAWVPALWSMLGGAPLVQTIAEGAPGVSRYGWGSR